MVKPCRTSMFLSLVDRSLWLPLLPLRTAPGRWPCVFAWRSGSRGSPETKRGMKCGFNGLTLKNMVISH